MQNLLTRRIIKNHEVKYKKLESSNRNKLHVTCANFENRGDASACPHLYVALPLNVRTLIQEKYKFATHPHLQYQQLLYDEKGLKLLFGDFGGGGDGTTKPPMSWMFVALKV